MRNQKYEKGETKMNHPLPRGWQEFALKDIGNFLRGSGISKKDLSDTGIPAIRYGDIYTKYDFVIKNVSSFTNSKGTELKKGDILFAGSGETAEEIGKSVAFIDDYKAFAGGDIIIFRPNIDLNSLFLSYILNSGKCRKDISIMGQGHTVVHIYASYLEILKVILPPLDEQKRIADILSTFDDLIENLNKLIEKKELYKKGVMQRVLTGEVRFNGFTDEWENVKLKDILIVGSKDRVLDTSKYKKITIKLHNKGIEFSNIERKMADKRPFYIRKKDEIIIGKQNYFNGSIAIVGEEFDNTICSNAIMSFTVNKNCNNKFIYFLLSRKSYMQKYYHLANGTGQKELSESDFLNFNLLIPRLEEQNKIAELLTLIDKDIEILKQLLHLRKLQKKGLMQKLLTGEVRI